MKFRRIFTPAVLIVTLLVQFLPGTVFAPRPVAASVACDAAQFVADVTIPDGTSFAPGAALIKTWRFKNIGTCTWSTSYAIVFYSGTKMGAPSAVNMPTSVAPGATVDVTVNMTAPTTAGHYRGNWMLRNASSVLFGVGPYGTYWFFIDIVVSAGYSTATYDFVANYCSAIWTSGAGTLPCPGTDGSASGYVINSAAPKLEDGSTDTTPGLFVGPQNVTDGYISGTYPAFTVQSGDRFQSIVSCAYGVPSCYVTFQLNYQIGSGPVYTFWQFREKTEGLYYRASVNLSSLAGQSVKFTLKVMASGSPTGDRVLWGGARIARLGGPTPPPVSTCDKAAFVTDVTIPDGTGLTGGTPFTKTWRLQNVGTCTWTTSYRLVFAGGDYMGASASAFNLPTSVAPGGSIDLSVNLAAPISAGNFIGYWKLRNASGTNFGVGASGTSAFLVNINVISSYGSAYDFVTNANSATWSSGAGALPWPGTDGDVRGFVLPLGSHQMEDGISSPEGLLTFPQYVTDGYIQGIYPGFTVQSGDHFQSYIGCQYGGPSNCYIVFRLSYQIGSGPVYTLKTAAERLEGLVYRMDVDLSALAGSNVKFILKVEAFGSPSGDRAVWSAPRIVRSGIVPPGPTSTPIPTSTPGPSPTPTPTVIVGPSANLSVTINDFSSYWTPNTSATYTVVVTNAGPSNVTGAVFHDNLPAHVTTWSWSCSSPDFGATCGAGLVVPNSSPINDTVNIPAGKHVTYYILANLGTVSPENLVNAVSITPPGGIPDPDLSNNAAVDSDVAANGDLSVTVTDGSPTYVPGGTTTYTITVTNSGPSNVTNALFSDTAVSPMLGWSWTCAPGAGNCITGTVTTTPVFQDYVNIPAGTSIVYTVGVVTDHAATGSLSMTASIAAPTDSPDLDSTDNTATDTDTPHPTADLSVTVTDGASTYVPGVGVTYTITVTNNGPSDVTGAYFSDASVVPMVSWTWWCTPPALGLCNIGPATTAPVFTDTVNIPASTSIVYLATVNTDPTATGSLAMTASITAPAGVTELVPGNNSATDTDTKAP